MKVVDKAMNNQGFNFDDALNYAGEKEEDSTRKCSKGSYVGRKNMGSYGTDIDCNIYFKFCIFKEM